MRVEGCIWKLSNQRVDCATYWFLSLGFKFILYACSVKMALVCLNVFPLPAGTEGLPVEGTGKTSQGGKWFRFLLLVGPLSGLLQHIQLSPAPVSWSTTGSLVPGWLLQCKVTTSTQWPAASPWNLPSDSEALTASPFSSFCCARQPAARSGQQLPPDTLPHI